MTAVQVCVPTFVTWTPLDRRAPDRFYSTKNLCFWREVRTFLSKFVATEPGVFSSTSGHLHTCLWRQNNWYLRCKFGTFLSVSVASKPCVFDETSGNCCMCLKGQKSRDIAVLIVDKKLGVINENLGYFYTHLRQSVDIFDKKLGHRQLWWWWQKTVFLTTPQDISSCVGGNKTEPQIYLMRSCDPNQSKSTELSQETNGKLTLKKHTAAAQRNATFGPYCGFAGGSVAIVPLFPSSWSCSFYRRKEEGGGQIEQPRDYKRTQQNRGRKRSGSSLWGQHQFRTNQVSRADRERERESRGEGGRGCCKVRM